MTIPIADPRRGYITPEDIADELRRIRRIGNNEGIVEALHGLRVDVLRAIADRGAEDVTLCALMAAEGLDWPEDDS